ncbi:MAG: hypothetical protein AB8I08_09525 [Sandaracinaceae bacterium]
MTATTLAHFERVFGPAEQVLERGIAYGPASIADGSRLTRPARFATFRVQGPAPGWVVVTLDLSQHDRVRPGVGTELCIQVPERSGAELALHSLEALSGYADERPGHGMLSSGRCTENVNTLMDMTGTGGLALVQDPSVPFLQADDKKATILRVVHLTGTEARATRLVGLDTVVAELGSAAAVYDVDREGLSTDWLRQRALEFGSNMDSVSSTFLSRRTGFLWRNVRLAIARDTGELLSLAIPARLRQGLDVSLTNCGTDIVFRRGPKPGLERVGKPSARAVSRDWTSGWQLFVTLDDAAEAELLEALVTPDFAGALTAIPRLSISIMSKGEISDHLHTLGGPRATRTF